MADRLREPAYHWVSALAGGNVVGARADRFEPVSVASSFLSGFGRSDRRTGSCGLEPPREVTIGVFRDRENDRTVAMMSYHLAPGVESGAEYRADRPPTGRRHESEVRRLERLIAEHQQAGHVVYAVGDSNFDGLRLAGLTSAWEGREDHPGTIGKATRKVDDVHGPGPASAVTLLTTPSDHRAVARHPAGVGWFRAAWRLSHLDHRFSAAVEVRRQRASNHRPGAPTARRRGSP